MALGASDDFPCGPRSPSIYSSDVSARSLQSSRESWGSMTFGRRPAQAGGHRRRCDAMGEDLTVDVSELLDGADADHARKGLRVPAQRLTCTEDSRQRLSWALSAVVETVDGSPLEPRFAEVQVFDESGLLVHVTTARVRPDTDPARGHVVQEWSLRAGSSPARAVRLVVDASEKKSPLPAQGTAKYPMLSHRDLVRVDSRPLKEMGRRATVWVEVAQVLDGGCFLAWTRSRPSQDTDDYDEPMCLFQASEDALEDVIDGDILEVRARVAGSHEYTTAGGTERTVPWWAVRRILPLVQVG